MELSGHVISTQFTLYGSLVDFIIYFLSAVIYTLNNSQVERIIF